MAVRSDQKRRADDAQAKRDAERYEDIKSRTGERARRVSAAGRDIGPPPAVVDPARRDSCRLDFRLFCETYAAESFPLAWSPDHLTAIGKIEAAVLRGELFAFAMPRGSGKTTLCEWACLWALLNGHRQFIVLIGSDQAIAEQMLDSIKSHLEQNDLLAADYPEATYPIRALEGSTPVPAGRRSTGRRPRSSGPPIRSHSPPSPAGRRRGRPFAWQASPAASAVFGTPGQTARRSAPTLS